MWDITKLRSLLCSSRCFLLSIFVCVFRTVERKPTGGSAGPSSLTFVSTFTKVSLCLTPQKAFRLFSLLRRNTLIHFFMPNSLRGSDVICIWTLRTALEARFCGDEVSSGLWSFQIATREKRLAHCRCPATRSAPATARMTSIATSHSKFVLNLPQTLMFVLCCHLEQHAHVHVTIPYVLGNPW